VDIVHPLLRQWVAGAPVATKLTATLSPNDMRQDVWLDWRPFSEVKKQYHSRTNALNIALNWASAVSVLGLVMIWIVRLAKTGNAPHYWRLTRSWLVFSLVLAALIYLGLPKISVRLERAPGGASRGSLFNLAAELKNDDPVTQAEIRARANVLLNQRARDDDNNTHPNFKNYLLGGSIREEDSPGNFLLRESADRLEFIMYDEQGAEHLEQDWKLRPPP
jgi:hypothetical protein